MMLMMLHNLVPHTHHSGHKTIHVEHHIGHSHHDENDNQGNGQIEDDSTLLHQIVSHHIPFSHDDLELIKTDKHTFYPEKNLSKDSFNYFSLKSLLIHETDLIYPKNGLNLYLYPFLNNCSSRAPPSLV